MRIVYVIEDFSKQGGMERIITDKMNYLASKTDNEITLLTVWRNKKPHAFALDERVRMETLDVPMAPVPFGYIPSLPLALRRFNKRIKALQPDVTIFFRAVGAFLCAFTSWEGKKVFESHSAYSASNHNWLYPLMQKKVDTVVCLTNGDAQSFSIARNVDVIPNFSNIATDALPDYDSHNVVFVGRNCPEKDIPRLHRLWEKVHATHPDWELLMYHDAPDVIKAYQSGSIFVMTSKAEGFGLVLLEAMNCSLPCIAFDCPHGPADIIKDGENGFLIPYSDDDAIIEKLSLLMDDATLRRQMGLAAKQSTQRYKQEHIMEQWTELFDRVRKQ